LRQRLQREKLSKRQIVKPSGLRQIYEYLEMPLFGKEGLGEISIIF
jgi:hypothetical protein